MNSQRKRIATTPSIIPLQKKMDWQRVRAGCSGSTYAILLAAERAGAEQELQLVVGAAVPACSRAIRQRVDPKG